LPTSKSELVSADALNALTHRLKHMNPRAPHRRVHFGEVPIAEVFDLRGFNLNAKLDIDPDFLKVDDHSHHHHGHEHAHGEHCDHDHGEHCDHPHHHHHDDDVKSFVFRSDRAFNPAKLEDFLGAIVQVYGPKMLRYKGVLNMKLRPGPEMGRGREAAEQDGVHRHRPAARGAGARLGRLLGLSRPRGKLRSWGLTTIPAPNAPRAGQREQGLRAARRTR
jgi:hypothetical protein